MGFWSTTPSTAQAGSTFDICIKDANLAGQTITVSVIKSNGDPGNPPTVDVKLDANGEGCKSYTAPGDAVWIELSVEEVTDTHRVDITQPTPPGE